MSTLVAASPERLAAATDVGCVRESNQDNLLALIIPRPFQHEAGDMLCLAVADGMGGYLGGEIAASTAMTTVQQLLETFAPAERSGATFRAFLHHLVQQANEAVLGVKVERPELSKMGTTLTVALCFGDRLFVGHVGDSRAYLLREDGAKRLTHDHTLVAEQLRQGLITSEEAETSEWRSTLSRAVGISADVEVDTAEFQLVAGDTVLLCTDGVHRYISDGEMAAKASDYDDAPSVCHGLLVLGKERGGEENLTVAVLRYDDLTPVTSDVAPDSSVARPLSRQRRHLWNGLTTVAVLLAATSVFAFREFGLVARSVRDRPHPNVKSKEFRHGPVRVGPERQTDSQTSNYQGHSPRHRIRRRHTRAGLHLPQREGPPRHSVKRWNMRDRAGSRMMVRRLARTRLSERHRLRRSTRIQGTPLPDIVPTEPGTGPPYVGKKPPANPKHTRDGSPVAPPPAKDIHGPGYLPDEKKAIREIDPHGPLGGGK